MKIEDMSQIPYLALIGTAGYYGHRRGGLLAGFGAITLAATIVIAMSMRGPSKY